MTDEEAAWTTLLNLEKQEAIISGRETDMLIARAMGWRAERQGHGRIVYRKRQRGYWQTMPFWSSSMEDAVRLYDPRPSMIPSDPIRCCMHAIRLRWQRDRPTLRMEA